MWGVFSLTYPLNKEKKWDLLLHQYRSPLDYVKRNIKILQKDSEVDQYVVQNLTWLGVYLRSNFSNTLLNKVLTLGPLIVTGIEVFVATMNTFLSGSYDALEETLTHMKSLKLNIYPWENVTYCYASILEDADRLEIAGAFKPEHLGYTTHIFENISDSGFRL